MKQEQIDRIIENIMHSQTMVQSVQEMAHRINHCPLEELVHPLAESIRSHSRHVYAGLTDEMVLQIMNEIQDQFGDVAAITLDDWANKDLLDRLVELHEHVRRRLAGLLHKECRQIGWGVAGKIINGVFGNVPVITKGVRKVLHETDFLHHPNTKDIRLLLLAVSGFWNRNRGKIFESIVCIISQCAIDSGRGADPRDIALNLAPMALSVIFRIIYTEIEHFQDVHRGKGK